MARNDMAGDQVCKFHQNFIDLHQTYINLHRFSSIYIKFQSKTISNPITEDVTGTMGHGSKDESVPSLVVIIISAIFIVSPKPSINIQIWPKSIWFFFQFSIQSLKANFWSHFFKVILILIVVVFFIRFKRARDAARTKCTAPNNTKLNGDTTMTPPGGAPGTNGLNGNPYGTIQRCGSGMRRPINNGFTTLEQHPHNTLR